MRFPTSAMAVLLSLGWMPVAMPAAAQRGPAPPTVAAQAPAAQLPGPENVQAGEGPASGSAPAHLPPVANLPALPRLPAPPTAVIGVLVISAAMRQSLAAREAERTLDARQQRLRQDAQAEQDTWRTMQQTLAGQQRKLTPDQLRSQSHALQSRIVAAQQRSNAIQQEGQVALGHIRQTLVAVVRQIAESRGMNLVIEGETTALNANDFDITKEAIARLNEVLPTVKQLMVKGPTSRR